VQEGAEKVLRGRGLAISVTPATATLPPFGAVTFALSVMSNMVGMYEDELECVVGDAPAKRFVARAGVAGSPLHVQKEAVLVPGLYTRNSTATALSFGAVPAGVQVSRSFSVFNLSSFQVSLELRLEVFERDPDKPWTRSSLQVQPDGSVRLAIRCAHVHSAANAGSKPARPRRSL
jgi:hypothetical protein